jgi:hypothetical protein
VIADSAPAMPARDPGVRHDRIALPRTAPGTGRPPSSIVSVSWLIATAASRLPATAACRTPTDPNPSVAGNEKQHHTFGIQHPGPTTQSTSESPLNREPLVSCLVNG